MFDRSVALLREGGHEVACETRDNRNIRNASDRVAAAVSGIYSLEARDAVRARIEQVRPEVVHLHNLYPFFSPSVIDACAHAGVPTVVRLADYSLVCPTAHHFRAGRVCEECTGGREGRCVVHRCRGDLLSSIAYAARTAAARHGRAFHDRVGAFSAPTHFVRDKCSAAGYPAERIHVVPNVVPIPHEPATPSQGEYGAYAGRLSAEKGIDVLMAAARRCRVPIVVAGQGPQQSAPNNVRFVGPLSPAGVEDLWRRARFAIVPSVSMEAFGLSCAEAMAAGVAPIASRIGGLPELVDHGRTGLLFEPGSAVELAKNMEELWEDGTRADALGRAARERASFEYNGQEYLGRLLKLYHHAGA